MTQEIWNLAGNFEKKTKQRENQNLKHKNKSKITTEHLKSWQEIGKRDKQNRKFGLWKKNVDKIKNTQQQIQKPRCECEITQTQQPKPKTEQQILQHNKSENSTTKP